jgi:hypothetical protein
LPLYTAAGKGHYGCGSAIASGDAAKIAHDDKRVDDLAIHVHVGLKYARASADGRSIGYEKRAYEKQAGRHIRMSWITYNNIGLTRCDRMKTMYFERVPDRNCLRGSLQYTRVTP